jgi:leader peptidase (prepilin peptidase)/N-methyltransferase
VVLPGSRCYACGTPVQWYDNLPILSYLILRGRCRWCGRGFSSRYLLVELAAGFLTAATLAHAFHADWLLPGFERFGPALPLIHPAGWAFLGLTDQPQEWMPWVGQALAAAALLVIVWYLLVCSLVDLDHMIIPDELTKGLQPLAPFLGIAVLPIVGGTYSLWPVTGWLMGQRFDGSPVFTPEAAGGGLLLAYVLVAVGLLLSLPLARFIYGRYLPEAQRWREDDHRAFRFGVIWFLIALLPALLVVLGIAWWPVEQPAFWQGWLVQVLGQAILGSCCGWLLPYLVGLGGTALFRRNAMGYGDVKFLAPIGAVLGPIGVLYCFLLAACLGTLIGVPLRLLGQGREIPFGPYLAGGALIALFAGPQLHHWIFTSLLIGG